MRLLVVLPLISLLALGCGKDKPKDATGSAGSSGSTGSAGSPGSAGSAGSAAVASSPDDLDSKDILARTEVAKESYVRGVLLSWREREAFYAANQLELDPRAQARDRAAAAKLAKEILAQLRAKPDSIGELIDKHSEDPQSKTGDPIRVEPGGGFPQPFITLALRLKEQEAGIVTTDFGFHVLLRVPKPPVDPLESADILKRDEESPPVYWQHIVIGWAERPANPDPRAHGRTKAEADALAKDLLAKVRAKGDMAKLMKQYSEDPRSKDGARPYRTNGGSTEPEERLAVRLKIDEAGLVRSALGWHVIKRVSTPPPPPPDKLESAAILKRKAETKEARVKHILVGWDEVNAGDPRGKKRTRAQLEKLVPQIVDRATKGEPFEKLMVEFSEDDPEAVKSGNSYRVSPDASLVQPFIDLSLRLKVGEIGVVATEFGIHVIKRVE
jgi:parvulin-like peptidyl-prolyl isomerase